MTDHLDAGEHTARPRRERSWRRHAVWVHLVYLAIPAFQPAFDPDAGWASWLLYGVLLAIFVPLYVAEMLRPRNTRLRFIIPVVVLGAVTSPFNPGMGVLFVYAAAAAAITEQPRVAFRWFAGLTVLAGVFLVVSTVPMPWRLWMLPNLLFIWVIGLIQLEVGAKERDAADLRIRNARIEHLATRTERERIARDLHDLLGHSLTAVIVRAQLVRGLVGTEPEQAGKEAAEIETTAREALHEVRSAVRGWRLTTLKAELDSARGMLSSVDVVLTVHRDSELTLASSAEHELALAAREALTNVARHAGASTCHVRIDSAGDDLRMAVADNGSGGAVPDGHGLRGVRERVVALGGSVRRDGSAGTTVTVSLPLRVAV